MVALFDLHGITQRTRGAGDNGDLLDGSGVALERRHQRMADLMVGHDALFLVGEDGVLLLVACDDHLDALLKVSLRHALAARADSPQSGFVDDVGQLCAGSAGGHPGHGVEVDAGGKRHLLGMDLQDLLAALEVGQLDRHTAVEAAGTGQGGVEGVRAVGGRKDDDAGVALKAIHLGEQLVQGLLPLIVAAQLAAVALLADGVDLIDKDDAGCFFLRLLEQVAHLGGTHAHEHLHELRAGDREEWHIGLTGHSFCQHGLAGARRADEEDALGHGSTDLLVFLGVVQIIDDLLQILFGLVLAGHIREADAVGGLDIDLGGGLAHAAEHHRVRAAGLLHQLPVHNIAQPDEEDDGQHEAQQKAHQRRGLLDDLAGKLCACVVKALGQVGVVHEARLVDLRFVFIGKKDLVGFHIHPADVLLLGHGHEGAVVHFLDLPFVHPRHEHEVEQHQHQQHDGIIDGQRLFGGLDFFHGVPSSPSPSALQPPLPRGKAPACRAG